MIKYIYNIIFPKKIIHYEPTQKNNSEIIEISLKQNKQNRSINYFIEEDFISIVIDSMFQSDKFHYLKILHCDDTISFISYYVKYLFKYSWDNMLNDHDNRKNIIEELTSGEIDINIWNDVMYNCCLNHRYRVYRKAYWGEYSGRIIVTNKKYHKDYLLKIYGPIPNVNNVGNIKITNLLIDNGNIKLI